MVDHTHIHPRWIFAAFVLAVMILVAERMRHQGIPIPPGGLHEPTLAAVLSNSAVWGRFREWLQMQQSSPHTIRHYHTILWDFWAELEHSKVTGPDGHKMPRAWHQPRPRDLDRWLGRQCRPGKRNGGQPLARSSRAAYSRRVLSFYRWASRKRLLPGRNPLEDVVAVRRPARQPRALPLGDVGALLHWWADDPRISMMICLGYYQLLRVGEIVALSVEDFHLRADPPIVRVQGKGGREAWMPVNPALLPYLRAYLAGRPTNGPLIANLRYPGEHLSARYASHLLATAMRPVVGETGHALRHTGARQLRLLTSDIRAIQEALRHASIASTEIYLQDEPVMLAGLLARLPNPLAQGGNPP